MDREMRRKRSAGWGWHNWYWNRNRFALGGLVSKREVPMREIRMVSWRRAL